MSWAVILALTPVPVGALPPPAPSTKGPVPAIPLNNPASWVTTNDYPPQALREDKEGLTEFLLAIGPDGALSDCRIMVSSGSPVLDGTTCELIRQRARFAPARDQAGLATSGTYRNRVRWTIPRPPAPDPGEFAVSFLVAPDGTTSDCRVETATGGAATMMARAGACERQIGRRYSRGYADAAGQPVTRRVRMTMKMELVPDK